MDPAAPGYTTYLLRLWNADAEQGPVWRVTLENPRTGERHVFLNLEALLAFLEENAGSAAAVCPTEEEQERT